MAHAIFAPGGMDGVSMSGEGQCYDSGYQCLKVESKQTKQSGDQKPGEKLYKCAGNYPGPQPNSRALFMQIKEKPASKK